MVVHSQLPQPSQQEEALLTDLHTNKLKVVDFLQWCYFNGNRVLVSVFSEVHHKLGLVDTGSLSFVSSSLAIKPTTIVSSANLTTALELCVATQLCMYREYRSGLAIQPFEAIFVPVLLCTTIYVKLLCYSEMFS